MYLTMLDIPEDIQTTLDLANKTNDEKLRQMAHKLLWSKIKRYGLRWEYFV